MRDVTRYHQSIIDTGIRQQGLKMGLFLDGGRGGEGRAGAVRLDTTSTKLQALSEKFYSIL